MPTSGVADIRAWLESRIGAGVRLGLSTCSEMLERLGNPQADFPSIHVAGTNGKGSLCAHLSALGSMNGELIGLFTSPHLVTIEERARIDGRPVSPEEFDACLEEVRVAATMEPEILPTYFETTFLASMLAFSLNNVDRAVIETGLGGRLDSTRLVEADICAITTISMDHSEVLGDTLPKIATEKAGIHRPGVPLLCLDHEDDQVRAAIEGVAGEDVIWVPRAGEDAQEVARSMASVIGSRIGWKDKETTVAWPGRSSDRINWNGVDLILSAAHNSESLSHDLGRLGQERHVLVVGMTQKQDLSETTEPLLLSDCRIQTVVTEVHGGRTPSVPAGELSKILSGHSEVAPMIIEEPIEAVDGASRLAIEEGCIVYVTGSIYLVGRVVGALASREGGDLWDYLEAHPSRS